MNSAEYPSSKTLVYSQKSIERAERSLICSPFNLSLFTAMRQQSVPLGAIAQDKGVKQGYTKYPLSELVCDNALSWLIQVGVLRREVDGQGITDSFRLTPLGYQLVEQLSHNWRQPTWRDRTENFLTRWLRLPF
ncbi:MAG TPA: hypothetical protein VK203_15390 [Nostocaceae cyanobacterium]|nr:hypothetical protein [Nostocaceae cyanobacterium]